MKRVTDEEHRAMVEELERAGTNRVGAVLAVIGNGHGPAEKEALRLKLQSLWDHGWDSGVEAAGGDL